jgi:flagellar biosynthesis protein FlhF
MKIRRYYGKTIREGLQRVKAELGPDSVILSSREVEGGIELLVAIDFDEVLIDQNEIRKKQIEVQEGREDSHQQQSKASTVDAVARKAKEPVNDDDTPSMQAIRKQLHVESLKKNLASLESEQTQAAGKQTLNTTPAGESELVKMRLQLNQLTAYIKTAVTDRREDSKTEIKLNALRDELKDIRDLIANANTNKITKDDVLTEPVLVELRKELKDIYGIIKATNGSANTAASTASSMPVIRNELIKLNDLMENQVTSLVWRDLIKRNPVQSKLLSQLMRLDLSPKLCKQLVGEMKASSNVEHAWRHALANLSNKLLVSGNDILTEGGIVVMHGPTGVGKTTTIAKLAARFAVLNGASQVAVITMDNHRIGAHAQLRTYANILNIPMYIATDRNDLCDKLNSLSGRKLILVDTAGLCQHDQRLIDQIEIFSIRSIKHRNYLVLSGTTNEITLEEILEKYTGIDLAGTILTKIDEAGSIGSMLSTLIEHKLSVAYVCDGQRVPEDIFAAHAYQLVTRNVALMKRHNKELKQKSINDAYERAVVNE